ncbi:unnamed protein product [Pleuronectes platessa]|uniref:Uncharacterized protein n=1 Tax=Pleuronectes platessa TaxID=8262 RepID=A0A9N7Y626_PLEPL|nr:unnamed protein product [Pleuronectes platessa]
MKVSTSSEEDVLMAVTLIMKRSVRQQQPGPEAWDQCDLTVHSSDLLRLPASPPPPPPLPPLPPPPPPRLVETQGGWGGGRRGGMLASGVPLGSMWSSTE